MISKRNSLSNHNTNEWENIILNSYEYNTMISFHLFLFAFFWFIIILHYEVGLKFNKNKIKNYLYPIFEYLNIFDNLIEQTDMKKDSVRVWTKLMLTSHSCSAQIKIIILGHGQLKALN